MEFIFVIIWIIAIISFITKAAKNATGTSKPQQRTNNAYSGSRPQQIHPGQVYDAQQEAIDRQRQAQQVKQTFRNVPSSTYGTTNTSQARRVNAIKEANQDRYAAAKTTGSAYGQVKVSRLGENAVLFEDRKNDWLAKQLREEAAIYRRGSGFDLGASHNASCEADMIKREHVKRHNSNGLNKQMFR